MGDLTPAVFLDRDGVINASHHDYIRQWSEFHFLPNVFLALRRLAEQFPAVIVVTNQSAIARGLLTHQTIAEIHRRMRQEIELNGGRIDAIYYCPHGPADECPCRKPRPGLLLQAARDYQLDLGRSFFVGDKVSDVEAAQAVGCSPIFVLTGEGAEHNLCLAQPRFAQVPVLADMEEATRHILRAMARSDVVGS